jgi:hypothetical protein
MPSDSVQQKLAARARRVAALRRRIVACVVATFVLAWGVVAFDGPMGAETTGVASTSPTTNPSTNETAASSPDDSASSDSSSADGSTLTTRQS